MVKSNLYNRLLIVIIMLNIAVGFSQNQRPKYINSPLMQPAYLQQGDTVMIVATAGILKDKAIVDDAIVLLQDWGLNVKLGKHLYAKGDHFAGTDAQRAQDFQEGLDDESVKGHLVRSRRIWYCKNNR